VSELEHPIDEQLSAYLDGELDQSERAEVDAALAASPALARRLEALGAVDDALRALPVDPPGADLAARLCERIAAEEVARTHRVPKRHWRWTVPLAASAAGVLALLVLRGGESDAPVAQLQPAQAPAPDDTTLTELALAIELDDESDLEVVELLDLLEVLGDVDEEGGSG